MRWDRLDADVDVDALILGALPVNVDFHTSGTTGPSRCWRRHREKVLAEAHMLAELLARERPEAVASFVPPVHLYGGLATVLVPALLRIPVWYRPSYFGAMPRTDHRRWSVIGTPWVFSLLLQHMSWVQGMQNVTVMHGGAMLPAMAADFLERAGADRGLIVEVFGSTEAGGVATRRWSQGEPPPWTLFPDVDLASTGTVDDEAPLVVRSPRLAGRPGMQAPTTWEMDDHVMAVDARRFTFIGRRSRLVNVNGRRIHLDEVEDKLRSAVRCVDLALVPTADPMIGEHVDLLVVLHQGTDLADIDMAAVISCMGVRPRRVHVMERIDRSDIGKLRRIQQPTTADAEALT